MQKKILWNDAEQRLRAGWRILIQILLTAVPLAVLGLSGFYSEGNQSSRVALTAGPATIISVVLCSRFIDKRKISDLGVRLGEKAWWADYGFGALAGFISSSALVLMLIFLGWGEVVVSNQWRIDVWAFIGSFLIALLSYLIVGIFEELMRAYQIKNAAEGLSRKQRSLTGVGLLAVILGALWSVIGHLSSGDPPFLVYILVTAVIYGLYILWTGKAALAMGIHFAWDLTLSTIFQLGAASEASLTYIRLAGMPDFQFGAINLLGIAAELSGLLLVSLWVWKREGRIAIQSSLTAYIPRA